MSRPACLRAPEVTRYFAAKLGHLTYPLSRPQAASAPANHRALRPLPGSTPGPERPLRRRR